MPRYEVLVVPGSPQTRKREGIGNPPDAKASPSTTCACVESMQHGAGAHMATVVVCILYWWKCLAEDNEEERDNHSIVSLNDYISV